MSHKASMWALMMPTGFTLRQKLILAGLAAHADDQGLCWPSVARLARMGNCTERSVYRVLAQLVAIGCLTVTPQPGKSSRYRLAVDTEFQPVGPVGTRARDPDSETPDSMMSGVPPTPDIQMSPTPDSQASGESSLNVKDSPPRPARASGVTEMVADRAAPLPADWTPDPDSAAFASSLGLDPATVGPAFVDHYRAAGVVSPDWPAKFRSWCRKEPEFAAKRQRGSGRPSPAEPKPYVPHWSRAFFQPGDGARIVDPRECAP